MSQPKRCLIANLGDASPLDYGGYLIWIDETGRAEGEYFEVEPGERFEIYRFSLDRCTFVNGVLSDNSHHPEHPAWFAKDIDAIAKCCDHPGIIADLTGEDVIARAWAYRSIGQYHGFRNLDDYPLQLSRAELCRRYVWLHSALRSLDESRRS